MSLEAELEARRREVLASAAALRVELPLRYQRQQAHFTTPAGDVAIARKAIEHGCARSAELLARVGLTLGELAEALDVPLAEIEMAISTRPPLVMIDNEDAQAARQDVVARGRDNAAALLRGASWGSTLRFFRPSGVDLDWCVQDITATLLALGGGADFVLDGIVWPKVRHPDELSFVSDALAGVERQLGLPSGRIRLAFLVESGWSVLRLPELVRAALPRLCAIVYGAADHAADLGLSAVAFDHPAAMQARAWIVQAAGAAGVPAIDSMTWQYPVADPKASRDDNRARVRERLRLCFDEALAAFRLGMQGKWVGHPLQLLVTLVAARAALPQREVDDAVARVEAYRAAVEREAGATVIAGALSDRATDRQQRTLLRRAVVMGRLGRERATQLGIISPEEAASG